MTNKPSPTLPVTEWQISITLRENHELSQKFNEGRPLLDKDTILKGLASFLEFPEGMGLSVGKVNIHGPVTLGTNKPQENPLADPEILVRAQQELSLAYKSPTLKVQSVEQVGNLEIQIHLEPLKVMGLLASGILHGEPVRRGVKTGEDIVKSTASMYVKQELANVFSPKPKHEFKGRLDRYCEAVVEGEVCNLPDRAVCHVWEKESKDIVEATKTWHERERKGESK